ncbi:hypothetical protein ACP70R_005751 [Stipagrostis hirtigluma subsp. patula]
MFGSTSTSSLPHGKMNSLKEPCKQIKLMTYNVWSREDVMVYKRIQAIGALVEKHNPDVIFFQEITPYIRSIFEDFAWWKNYHCSPVVPEEQATKQHICLLLSKHPLENFGRWKFANSPTGRGYLEADINPDPATMPPIRVATTQLERPNPPASMHCMERYVQAEHAVAALSSAENVVFGGEGIDRPFPLPAGWFDAWTAWMDQKRCSDWSRRWTYDGIWEEELGAFNGYVASSESLKWRSDRFVCKLKDYRLNSTQLIGDGEVEPRYTNRKRSTQHEVRSIIPRPSCHRGLILTIVPNEPARPEVPPAPAPGNGGGGQAAGVQCTNYWDDSD